MATATATTAAPKRARTPRKATTGSTTKATAKRPEKRQKRHLDIATVKAAQPATDDADGGYAAFLAGKRVQADAAGFEVDPATLNPHLFDWQRAIVAWALRRGRAALFEACGLGKSVQQLAWADAVCRHTGGDVLILAPLAVAAQTRDEGAKFGIPVTICRTQADVRRGINITNYEMLSHFDPPMFAGIVLDESSVLKNYSGKVKQALVSAFADTPFRLCCTATPAPNDHMELGNHAEFLGIMRSGEMLMRWFINDTMHSGHYRLKGHAERDFWEWVASWAVSVRRPSDLGYSDAGFDVPPLTIRHEIVEVDLTQDRADGQLFRTPSINATTMHAEMRRTAAARAERVAALVNGNSEDTWAVWCNTNYEADELVKRIPDAVEVRGSESIEAKERKLLAFLRGEARVLISKASIAGYGLNLQHCHRTAFVGLSYSFEDLHQAISRFHRFGQTHVVEAVVVAAETEGAVLASVERKMEAYDRMCDAMVEASSRRVLRADLSLRRHETFTSERGRDWTLYHGDCVAVTRSLPDASVHLSIFSPPFSQLYTYSDAIEDMGNCADDGEFFRHFDYLIPELHRITVPGRLCAVHCKQLPMYKGRDGMAGLRDFRGEIIRHFTAAGWAYHSEVCIWKDPVIEMQRTKAHGLLYKQLRADSSFSRQGMAEYLLVFRRWPKSEAEEASIVPVTHTKEDVPLELWQRYASPVWTDIRQTRVLNIEQARNNRDEKHICPLQLDVIERAVDLWTNPGEVVFSPFAGIGSEGHVALGMHRRFVGVELKDEYFRQAVKYLQAAAGEAARATLWDGFDLDTASLDMEAADEGRITAPAAFL